MGWTKTLKNIVSSVAPTIGGALGGPAGGVATKFLAEKLLGKPDATEDEVTEYIATASPETKLRLKELDIDFKKFSLQIGLDLAKLGVEDTKDARARDIKIRETTKGKNWRADILAYGAMVGLIALIWTLLFVNIPDGPARDVLLILSGALVAIVKDVYQFEFGSSRGSKEKDGIFNNFRSNPKEGQ